MGGPSNDWRGIAIDTMKRAIAGKPPEKWEQAIRVAYPFGERRRWPYKVWLRVKKEFLIMARFNYDHPQRRLWQIENEDEDEHV